MVDEIQNALHGLGVMYFVQVVAMVAVMIAMSMDLMFGWRKAKERGDARTSYAFSRTINKFALYEGVLLISCCIDTLIHFVWAQFSTGVYSFPVASCILAMVLCIVEIWSMKEKADEKTRNNLNTAIKVVAEAIPKEQAQEVLKSLLNSTPTDAVDNE